MVNYNDIHKYEGFKLISLELRENKLMAKSNLFYSFIDSEDKQKVIYTTVLIGTNGTGKSNLFRIVIELFKELYDLSQYKKRSYNVFGRFNLKFSLHGDIFEYSNIEAKKNRNDIEFNIAGELKKRHPAFLLRNKERIDFSEVQLPLSIVANSIMVTDKFPFYQRPRFDENTQNEVFPQYKYLGVRNMAQSASTRAYIRKTVEFIVEQKESIHFRNGLLNAIEFLQLDNTIEIFYKTAYPTRFFKGDLNSEKIHEYFGPMKAKYSEKEKRPPDKLTNYLKIRQEDGLIEQICTFCNELVIRERLVKLGEGSGKKFSYDVLDSHSLQKLRDEFKMVEYLRQLGLIYPPEIQLYRVGSFSLEESSSGEYHFFTSIIGLMATVKNYSLVLIDEPEVSLHPNWQMKYLSFIRELFSHPEYSTSHILVATHSHFLISDLKGESSKIIGLKKENGKIQVVDLPKNIDTFGWSAEEVLLKVFNVVTTRNYFVAEKLGIILDFIADENSNKQSIKAKFFELELDKVSGLSEEDPLKTVFDTIIKEYVQ